MQLAIHTDPTKRIPQRTDCRRAGGIAADGECLWWSCDSGSMPMHHAWCMPKIPDDMRARTHATAAVRGTAGAAPCFHSPSCSGESAGFRGRWARGDRCATAGVCTGPGSRPCHATES